HPMRSPYRNKQTIRNSQRFATQAALCKAKDFSLLLPSLDPPSRPLAYLSAHIALPSLNSTQWESLQNFSLSLHFCENEKKGARLTHIPQWHGSPVEDFSFLRKHKNRDRYP